MTEKTTRITQSDMPAFVTIRAFVRPSGLSEGMIRNLVRQGQIPFLRSGNRVLIDVQGALDAIRTIARR